MRAYAIFLLCNTHLFWRGECFDTFLGGGRSIRVSYRGIYTVLWALTAVWKYIQSQKIIITSLLMQRAKQMT